MQCEQFTFYQNNLLKYDIMNIQKIMSSLEAKHPGELEYLQAVKEVLLSIEDIYNQHPEFEKAKIIERLVEPDRIFTFRPVQRRYSFPCFRQPLHFEIPRLRADIQECADYPSDGWRQRRFGLLTPWQERC